MHSFCATVYSEILSTSVLITFLSPVIATSVDKNIPCLPTLILMSSL